MSESARKLIGMIVLLVFLGIYSLLVMALGASRLLTLGWAVELAYYAVAGLLWVPVAILIIRWMQKPVP